ncbi:hypothetical protein [Ferrovum sp.]|uniref:hypothetical protein n=1 Tax=Ferrovum sp. TaxID=2609467 RepID=UPI0026161292|nr:hypothetical protein [Ferrovum sp.]
MTKSSNVSSLPNGIIISVDCSLENQYKTPILSRISERLSDLFWGRQKQKTYASASDDYIHLFPDGAFDRLPFRTRVKNFIKNRNRLPLRLRISDFATGLETHVSYCACARVLSGSAMRRKKKESVPAVDGATEE